MRRMTHPCMMLTYICMQFCTWVLCNKQTFCLKRHIAQTVSNKILQIKQCSCSKCTS